MLDAGNQFLASRFVAFKRVGDDNPRDVAQALEEFAEETLGGPLITPRLNQDIKHRAVLIHCAPEVKTSVVDAEIDLIQMPFIASAGRAATRFVGKILAEFQTPLADRLVEDWFSNGSSSSDSRYVYITTNIRPGNPWA